MEGDGKEEGEEDEEEEGKVRKGQEWIRGGRGRKNGRGGGYRRGRDRFKKTVKRKNRKSGRMGKRGRGKIILKS